MITESITRLVDQLARLPGIGKKSAGRIVLELKEKAAKIQPMAAPGSHPVSNAADSLHDDALSALVNLGYRAADVKEALKRLTGGQHPPSLLQDVIRDALKELAKG